ncbi:hypothetical protein [Demequina muriae]|uniref:Uncharacterized protein n=1 Tax=Demequina muriae TaxID=3051664 RepID=A0ABT8GIM6_9MICO|nr:hypothetical protein [Demequina sp. EGI L300058]MDN4481285.1 hypothetical protein [Demequina sp. EGI L300058]
MSDAREAFHDLHGLAGAGFDDSTLADGPDRVGRRVARWRDVRAALMSAASIVAIAAVAVGVNEARWAEPMPGEPLAPTVTASAMPEPGVSTGPADRVGCAEATVVPGKAVGNFGGLEGWFNGTPVAPCAEWDEQILDHPDTVLIHTGDNTMVEAYYRTSIDALGVYADLGPDFAVPNPAPDWPADSFVLIDARTGEVLETWPVSDFATDLMEEAQEAERLDERLVADANALADHLESLAASEVAPEGYVFETSSRGAGDDSDIASVLTYEPTPRPSGPLGSHGLAVRLQPGDNDELMPPEATLVERDLIVPGSVMFEYPGTDSLQLSIPIGSDAHLTLVGNGNAADGYLLVPFAREILAE